MTNFFNSRYAHITSFEAAGRKQFAKASKDAASYNDDNDVDLFGSNEEEEDAEAAKICEERLAAYAAKKSKKPSWFGVPANLFLLVMVSTNSP